MLEVYSLVVGVSTFLDLLNGPGNEPNLVALLGTVMLVCSLSPEGLETGSPT